MLDAEYTEHDQMIMHEYISIQAEFILFWAALLMDCNAT